jgi:hypothetical protein
MWITVLAVTTGLSLSCVVLAILNERREAPLRYRNNWVRPAQ